MALNSKSIDNGSSLSLYDKLVWRNRFILFLRFLVPFFGLVIFGFLIIKIIIANIGSDIDISGIRVERNNVVINSPQYSGVTANGTSYSIISKSATTAIDSGSLFDLSDANFAMKRPDGLEINASAKQAFYNIIDQNIKIDGEMIVNDSRGIKAKLINNIIDWNTQSLNTKNKVEIVFSDGSILNSNSLFYDSANQSWKFNDVELILEMK